MGFLTFISLFIKKKIRVFDNGIDPQEFGFSGGGALRALKQIINILKQYRKYQQSSILLTFHNAASG